MQIHRLSATAAALFGLTFAFVSSPAAQVRQMDLEWSRFGGASWSGVAAHDRVGWSVAGAGDVNGDGYEDLLIGAPAIDPLDVFFSGNGRAYIFYGGPTLTGDLSVANADVTLLGEAVRWETGFSVAGVGDVNGDGYDDILIGAPNATTNGNTSSGRAYLVYGGPALPAQIPLSTLGAGGLTINGEAFSNQAGYAVAGAGDVNGDGYPDLLIGAPGANVPGKNFAGKAYLVHGGPSLPTLLELSALGAGGTVIHGRAASVRLGWGLAGAGHVNADGFADILVGAPRAAPAGKTNAGEAYLIHGSAALPAIVDTAALGALGVTIRGAAAGDLLGETLSGGADVNGDGRADLLLGSQLHDPGGVNNAGAAWLVYGGTALPSTIDLATFPSAAGVFVTGSATGDNVGFSVALGGDANQDGYGDLLIGAQAVDPDGKMNAGGAYLVYGGPSLPSALPLGSLGSRGVLLAGVSANDIAGTAVAFAGDMNGDGYGDLLVGARAASNGPVGTGEAHLVKGTPHMIMAKGPVAEGGVLDLHVHGTPGVPNLLFAAAAALDTPLVTPFGPWFLIAQIDLVALAFDATGRMHLPLLMPAPGAVPGLLGATLHMQVIGAPQGQARDLTWRLSFVVE